MKYVNILGLVFLGFIAHKALEEMYDFKFEQGFQVCGNQYIKDTKDSSIEGPLTKRFKCTYEYMGPYAKLSLILMRPHFSDSTGARWYY